MDQFYFIYCDNCQVGNNVLTTLWSKECFQCQATILAPQKEGYKYTEINCSMSPKPVIYNVPVCKAGGFSCRCCEKQYRIGSKVVRRVCGQNVYECDLLSHVIENLEKDKRDLQILLRDREDYILDIEEKNEALKAENAKVSYDKALATSKWEQEKQKNNELLLSKDNQIKILQWELDKLRPSETEAPKLIHCEICGTPGSLGENSWGVQCCNEMCRNLNLMPIPEGNRYVITDCKPMGYIYRLEINITKFECICCSMEFNVESTVSLIKNGQPVYATRLAEEPEDDIDGDGDESHTRDSGCWEDNLNSLHNMMKDPNEQNSQQQLEIASLRNSKTAEQGEDIVGKVTEDVIAKIQPEVAKMFDDYKVKLEHYDSALTKSSNILEEKDKELAQKEAENGKLKNDLGIMSALNDKLQKLNMMAIKKIGNKNESKDEENNEEEVEEDDLVQKFKSFLGF